MRSKQRIALIIGSGPNAVDARGWDGGAFDDIVAINNAWRIRQDWTHLIHPDDFPVTRQPMQPASGQRLIRSEKYVPATNLCGGMVFCGGTMAFTAAYWALIALQPDVMAFIGCDMVYPSQGPTHFYGTGTADPLRDDPTLLDLKAKSARVALMAAVSNCAVVNLSTAESNLVYPRATIEDIRAGSIASVPPDMAGIAELRAHEDQLEYDVPDGRYWKVQDGFNRRELARVDAAWSALYAATAWQGDRVRVA